MPNIKQRGMCQLHFRGEAYSDDDAIVGFGGSVVRLMRKKAASEINAAPRISAPDMTQMLSSSGAHVVLKWSRVVPPSGLLVTSQYYI